MYNFANICEFSAYFANRCKLFASACKISNFTIRHNEFAKKNLVSHILGYNSLTTILKYFNVTCLPLFYTNRFNQNKLLVEQSNN